jgi:hypothetical protein
MEDGVMEDGVMEDGVMEDGVMEDGVMEVARKLGERNWRNATRNRDSPLNTSSSKSCPSIAVFFPLFHIFSLRKY